MQRSVHIAITGKLTLIAFSLLLSLPVLLAPLADHDARAAWEKRELSAPTHLLESLGEPDWFATLESVIDDHLFYALEVNRAYRRAQYAWFNDAPVANVALGKGDLVFLTSHSARRPYQALELFCEDSPAEADALHAGLVHLAETLRARDVALTVAVMPSKTALYTDRLPPEIPTELRKHCVTNVPEKTVVRRLAIMERPYELFYPLEALASQRDTPHFYPPENFHANSRANHEFGRLFLESKMLFPGEAYENGERLETITADLRLMGFEREVKAWRYDYPDFELKRLRRAPDWLREVYAGARGFGRYVSAEPLAQRRALILSDSFGAFVSPHLAPGYAALMYVNIKHLKSEERLEFLQRGLDETAADELIILVHDAGLPNQSLRRFLDY